MRTAQQGAARLAARRQAFRAERVRHGLDMRVEFDSTDAFVAHVSRVQNKAGANPSDRSTRHIEVQLPSNIAYRVGDHLSVVPRNDPALVDSVARRFGFLPADQIRLQVAEGRRAQLPVGDTVSVGRLLSEFVELQQVATRKQIQIMSEHTRCPVTKPKLLAYVGDDAASSERYRSEVLAKRKSVFDLLEEYPACELPFHAYLEMLSLLAPRYYSISSSPSRWTAISWTAIDCTGSSSSSAPRLWSRSSGCGCV